MKTKYLIHHKNGAGETVTIRVIYRKQLCEEYYQNSWRIFGMPVKICVNGLGQYQGARPWDNGDYFDIYSESTYKHSDSWAWGYDDEVLTMTELLGEWENLR